MHDPRDPWPYDPKWLAGEVRRVSEQRLAEKWRSDQAKVASRPRNKTTLRKISRRQQVYERDKFRCRYCQKNFNGKHHMLSLDHVLPRSRGGANSLENLVTCCKQCNWTKKDRTPDEAGMFLWPPP